MKLQRLSMNLLGAIIVIGILKLQKQVLIIMNRILIQLNGFPNMCLEI